MGRREEKNQGVNPENAKLIDFINLKKLQITKLF